MTPVFVFIAGVVTTGLQVAAAVDDTLCRVPPYRASRSWLLDRLLGPAEPFEYTSLTTPAD